jgi:hypothetical protein
VAWEDGLVASKCTLGTAHVECDAECDRAEAARQDYRARIHAFMVSCRHSFNIDRILEERQILLSLHGMDLERQEEKLEEEQPHGLHSLDGRYLSTELKELRKLMAGVESDRPTEVVTLSWSVMEISDAFINLGVFPIRDIHERLQSARDVLMVAGLILERLQEERDSGAGPWV